MTNIYNATPHTINIYAESDTTSIQGGRKLILDAGALPLTVIKSGVPVNCTKQNLAAPSIQSDIPLTGAVVFTAYDSLPAGYDIYIVSNLYRSAVKELGGDTSKLATVDGTVYDSESSVKPVGVLRLAVG